MIGYYGIKKVNKDPIKLVETVKLIEVVFIPWVLHAIAANRNYENVYCVWNMNQLEDRVISCKEKGKIPFGENFKSREIEIPDEYIKRFVDKCYDSSNDVDDEIVNILQYVLEKANNCENMEEN